MLIMNLQKICHPHRLDILSLLLRHELQYQLYETEIVSMILITIKFH